MNLMQIILLSFLYELSTAFSELNETSEVDIQENKVLSRKKRFLIFPDGSSFQIVFCTQNMGYLRIGDVIWFGNTAALAWELPTDPNIFYFLKQEDKIYGGPGLRRQDNKHIVYLDEDGKVISAVPYRKKPIVNPAFAKRSIESKEERSEIKQLSIKEMHEIHNNKNLVDDLDKASIEFHREGRKGLYEKLEFFLEGLGWEGKKCILRFLCETARAEQKQGTFLEEIMRATFTFPKSLYAHNEHKDYDIASTASDDCEDLYPECVNHQGTFKY